MISIESTSRKVAVWRQRAFNAASKLRTHHGLWYRRTRRRTKLLARRKSQRAGGLCCVKYGVTTTTLGAMCAGRWNSDQFGGKRIKDVEASVLKLFVGSGGTLGIITRAVLRLIPAQGPRSTLVAYFATVQAAADTVVAIGRTLRASMMELMDQTSINAVEDYRSMGLDRSAGAMLIAQSDAPGAACAAEIELMEAACNTAGAKEVFITTDQEEGELFVAARRAAFPAIEARGSILLERGRAGPELPELLAASPQLRSGTRRGSGGRARRDGTSPITIFERGYLGST